MEDEYYNNVISWSKKDMIAIVLANSIFILNNKDGKIKKLYQAFECEEISSL